MSKIFILAAIVWLGTAHALGTETNFKFRECVANGNSADQCALTHYGR